MDKSGRTMAEQVARAASTFHEQSTGHKPKSVPVVLSEDTLVITLHEALTPAEKAMAQSTAGAAQVREFHRQLFTSSAAELRQEIERVTGVEIREATAEIETTTGTMVQIFLLARSLSAEAWNGIGSGNQS